MEVEIIFDWSFNAVNCFVTTRISWRQWLSTSRLDQEYQAEFENLAGELTTRGDGLSRFCMPDHVPWISINDFYDNVPSQVVDKVFAIDKTGRIGNINFPSAMSLIKLEQDKDERIQTIIARPELQEKLSKITFGNVENLSTCKPSKIWSILEWLRL